MMCVHLLLELPHQDDEVCGGFTPLWVDFFPHFIVVSEQEVYLFSSVFFMNFL